VIQLQMWMEQRLERYRSFVYRTDFNERVCTNHHCSILQSNKSTSPPLLLSSPHLGAASLALLPVHVQVANEFAILARDGSYTVSTSKWRKRNLSIDIEQCAATAWRPHCVGHVVCLEVFALEGAADAKGRGGLDYEISICASSWDKRERGGGGCSVREEGI
jgi:hypothetical protein